MHDKTSSSDKIAIKLNGKTVYSDMADTIDANSSSAQFNVTITLKDKDGNIKHEKKVHNLVTQAGKNAIADQVLASPTLAKAGWMAVGTGTPAATLLGAEISRVALTSKTRSGSVLTFQGDWGAGVATGAITEAGIFDVVTANTVNMWASQNFSVINKSSTDTLSIVWTLTLS